MSANPGRRPPTTLVTGGAGFIGTNLCRKLLEEGHRVIVVDDLSEGEIGNLDPFKDNRSFEFVQSDIRNAEIMADLCRRCTHVVHLAARKIPRYGGSLQTLDVNGDGSRTVLRAANDARCRMVIASTSDVYGRNPEQPFDEYKSASVIGNPTVRRWSYAVSKMFEEQYAFAMRDELGLEVTIVRYFGGYGPYQHRGWLGGPQSVFMERAFAGEPLSIHGDGSQSRAFTYVDDLVDGTFRALTAEIAVGRIYNIGSSEEISVLEMAKRCWRLARDDEPRLEFQPYKTLPGNYEDVLRRTPDITHAREDLQFLAGVTIDDGLQKTWNWMVKERLR